MPGGGNAHSHPSFGDHLKHFTSALTQDSQAISHIWLSLFPAPPPPTHWNLVQSLKIPSCDVPITSLLRTEPGVPCTPPQMADFFLPRARNRKGALSPHSDLLGFPWVTPSHSYLPWPLSSHCSSSTAPWPASDGPLFTNSWWHAPTLQSCRSLHVPATVLPRGLRPCCPPRPCHSLGSSPPDTLLSLRSCPCPHTTCLWALSDQCLWRSESSALLTAAPQSPQQCLIQSRHREISMKE